MELAGDAESRPRRPRFGLHLPDYAAFAIVLIAAFLRFQELAAKSFWLDELVTVQVIRLSDFREMLDWLAIWSDHTPFHWVLTWVLRPFGGGEVAARVPVAIAGTLTVAAVYLVGRSMGGPRAGLFAAALAAVSPYAVFYSQEARPYAFLMLWTTLQMLCAHKAASDERWRWWVGLGLVTVLNLWTGFLALAPTVVVGLWMGLVVLVPVLAQRRREGAADTSQVRRGAVIGLAVAATYVPLVPSLLAFLNRPDLGFGRVAAGHVPTMGEAMTLLDQLGLGTPALLVLIGLGMVSVVASAPRDRGGGLLCAWLLIPLFLFWLRTGGGIVLILNRYFALLVPAAWLLASFGAEAVVRRVTALGGWPRGLQRIGESATVSVLAFAVLLAAPAALARYYDTPKSADHRAAAAAAAAMTGPDGVVLTVGQRSDWLTLGLVHHFWVDGVALPIVDATLLDAEAIELLHHARSVTAVFFDGVETPGRPPVDLPGWPSVQVPGIRIAASPGDDALASAATVIAESSSNDPRLERSARLLQILSAAPGTGGGLLPEPTDPASAPDAADGWWIPAGARLSASGGGFVVEPTGNEIDVTAVIAAPAAATELAFTFECRVEGGVLGNLFISAHNEAMDWLEILPDGGGYVCPPSGRAHSGGFLFDVPHGTTLLNVRVRAKGVGKFLVERPYLRALTPTAPAALRGQMGQPR